MRSPFPTPRPDRFTATLAVGALVLGTGGCGSDAATVVANAAPDRVLVGPQGAVGQFAVECELSHLAPDDPIVHPGHAGASHLHQFFGSVGVRADSTYEEAASSETTCGQQGDSASYWAPVLLLDAREPVEAIRAVAYYRAGPDVEPTSVEPYPPGMMLVAGDATAIEPQPLSVVAWSCGTGSLREVTPPDCTGAPSLRMIVTYPDCWNGVAITSTDWTDPATRHAVYSEGGSCPTSHPVHIPQLQFAVDYPPVPADQLADLALSSGDIHSGHADFWNTWQQEKLTNEIEVCIHRDLVCNVSS
jgi:hypothetical protein